VVCDGPGIGSFRCEAPLPRGLLVADHPANTKDGYVVVGERSHIEILRCMRPVMDDDPLLSDFVTGSIEFDSECCQLLDFVGLTGSVVVDDEGGEQTPKQPLKASCQHGSTLLEALPRTQGTRSLSLAIGGVAIASPR